jgi:hypothetical protein
MTLELFSPEFFGFAGNYLLVALGLLISIPALGAGAATALMAVVID